MESRRLNGTFTEDLPQDWRLSYYANEFTGVLVPEPVWRAADPSIIGGWLEMWPMAFCSTFEAA